MEAKKSTKANLENKRALFFQIGVLTSLLVVLMAFSWNSAEKTREIVTNAGPLDIPTEIIVPITPPVNDTPPPVAPVLSNIFEIIGNEIDVGPSPIFKTDNIDAPIIVLPNFAPPKEPEKIDPDVDIPIFLVENKPKFNGSENPNAFGKWVAENLTYPESARESTIAGRVTVQFVVAEDGTVQNVTLIRGIEASLDKEVLRVIASSPKWEPGRQRDKAVRVSYIFPVVFELK